MSDLSTPVKIQQANATPIAINSFNGEYILLLLEAKEFQPLEMSSGYDGFYYHWRNRVYFYWDGEMMDGFLGTDLAEVQVAVKAYYGYDPTAPRSRYRYVMTGMNTFVRYTETVNVPLPPGAAPAPEYDLLSEWAFLHGEEVILQCKHSKNLLHFTHLDDYYAYTSSLNRSIGFGHNPYGEHFSCYGLDLRNQLASALGLAADFLDFSPGSLSVVDDRLANMSPDDPFFVRHLLAIVAYLGEVYIRNQGGEWRMNHQADGSWIPMLLTADQQSHYLFSDLWEELKESDHGLSSLALRYHFLRHPLLIGVKSEEPLQPR